MQANPCVQATATGAGAASAMRLNMTILPRQSGKAVIRKENPSLPSLS
jgi:hypothetical protein